MPTFTAGVLTKGLRGTTASLQIDTGGAGATAMVQLLTALLLAASVTFAL